MARQRIVLVSSEAAPYARTGGLGDVSGALSKALAGRGHEVHLVLPLYGSIDRERWGLRPAGFAVEAWMPGGAERCEVWTAQEATGGRAGTWFVQHPRFDRPELYGEGGGAYGDNHLRFAILGRAAIEIAAERCPEPDVVHLHDWQTGLCAADLRARRVNGHPRGDARFARTRIVFTIHNLAYAGVFNPEAMPELGLPWELYTHHRLEFFGRMSFLKAGLVYADALTTVSPRYSREIRTSEFGCGLEGLLNARADALHGIVNGIDPQEWNPAADPHLPAHYDAGQLGGKARCKAALQRELGLHVDERRPLCGVVARLAWQKGIDLVADAAQRLLARGVQLAVLGTGEPALEARLAVMAARNHGRMAVRLGFDEPLSHRIEAGSDLFLMPSRYEPCGLNQMYSLRYGAVPVVRAVGGLDDTVEEYDAALDTGTGFKFGPPTAEALGDAVERAVRVWQHPDQWRALVRRGMQRDFSWDASAATYERLFDALLREEREQAEEAGLALDEGAAPLPLA